MIFQHSIIENYKRKKFSEDKMSTPNKMSFRTQVFQKKDQITRAHRNTVDSIVKQIHDDVMNVGSDRKTTSANIKILDFPKWKTFQDVLHTLDGQGFFKATLVMKRDSQDCRTDNDRSTDTQKVFDGKGALIPDAIRQLQIDHENKNMSESIIYDSLRVTFPSETEMSTGDSFNLGKFRDKVLKERKHKFTIYRRKINKIADNIQTRVLEVASDMTKTSVEIDLPEGIKWNTLRDVMYELDTRNFIETKLSTTYVSQEQQEEPEPITSFYLLFDTYGKRVDMNWKMLEDEHQRSTEEDHDYYTGYNEYITYNSLCVTFPETKEIPRGTFTNNFRNQVINVRQKKSKTTHLHQEQVNKIVDEIQNVVLKRFEYVYDSKMQNTISYIFSEDISWELFRDVLCSLDKQGFLEAYFVISPNISDGDEDIMKKVFTSEGKLILSTSKSELKQLYNDPTTIHHYKSLEIVLPTEADTI
jgi:hypothetical protein